jgi:hypothetical protein
MTIMIKEGDLDGISDTSVGGRRVHRFLPSVEPLRQYSKAYAAASSVIGAEEPGIRDCSCSRQGDSGFYTITCGVIDLFLKKHRLVFVSPHPGAGAMKVRVRYRKEKGLKKSD